jgi:predicted nucleotidyltransferase
MNNILRVIKGSQVYGTTIETSDTDYFSLFKYPIKEYLKYSFKEQIDHNKDGVSMKVGKFIHLLTKSFQIQIKTLFTPKKYVLNYDKILDELFDNKELFLKVFYDTLMIFLILLMPFRECYLDQ